MMKRETKYKMNIIIGTVIALIYVIVPFDLSPDAVPVMGWVDDLIAILLAVSNGMIFASKLKKKRKE